MISCELVVLIPHYNDLRGLYKSLGSISEMISLDVLIVDDGSIEKPDLELLKSKFDKINNIKILFLDNNLGIASALNEGLHYINNCKSYKYIARLDTGDTCVANRFRIQYNYLEENPEVYLLGTWANCVDETGNILYQFEHSTNTKKIKKYMYFRNEFVHSSVMFRSEAINKIGYYPTLYTEDYAYFFKFVKNYKTENLPLHLINYEINPNGLTMKNRKTWLRSRMQVIIANFEISAPAIVGLIYSFAKYFIPVVFFHKIKLIKFKYQANLKP